MRPVSWALLLALASIWGASFLFIKTAVGDTSPIMVATLRVLFGSLAIGLVFVVRRPRFSSRRVLVKMAVPAVVGSVLPFVLIPWGQWHVESGIASLFNGAMPLFTGVLAAGLLREERMNANRAAGLLLGLAGIALLTAPDVRAFGDELASELAIVLATLSYAAGYVYSQAQLKGEDAITLAGGQVMIAALILVPIAGATGPDLTLGLKAWLSVITLGAAGTGLALILYYRLLAEVGSVRASLVTYLMPIVALILGATVLDETFDPASLAGGALIIAGVVVASGGLPFGRRMKAAPAVAVTAGAD